MANNDNKVTLLNNCLAKSQPLAELVQYSADSIVSKPILDKYSGTITIFAFDAGQKLSEHTSPYDAVVQILDGKASLTIGGEDIEISAGQIIIMPSNVPHAVTAKEKFKMLLTMIRV